MDTDVLEGALADFSRYVAADALSAGPFCMLSAVANRRSKRRLSAVLEHAPTHEDSRACLGWLQTALTARGVTLVGSTTVGSALSPDPWAARLRGVPQHSGVLPGLAEVVQAGLGAVASARKRLRAPPPTGPKGRPSPPAAQAAARQKNRRAQQRVDLYPQRPLCVPRHLSHSERQPWWRLTRGRPPWRPLRARMAQVYALFERRGRTQTALDT